MKVTIRFKDYPAVAERVLGSVLTLNECNTIRSLRDGLSYKTDVSPMVVLAAFEAEGIDWWDFASISFEP
jgi:hypothetical protein